MTIKKIPYGVTDFEMIRKEDYYFVDKTRYVEVLEKTARFFFLIRPRRFGKSLFINMLRWYYDIYRRDRFKEIFEGLYIGSHPTAEQGKYLVLDFNFAGVNPDPDRLLASFNDNCSMRFDLFAGLYGHMFNPGFASELKRLKNADEKLNYLIGQATLLDLPIYLFIDEYDNFTNAILANVGNEHYRKLTHGTGFFRYFFNKLKEGATGNGPIKRMFITGVSPVTMDDVTSGFNIGANMSTDPRFNGIIGFSEREVRDMLSYYKDVDMLAGEVDEVIGVMKPWYDNYCFSRDSLHEPMYNSDMVLYFLNHYLPLKKVPENMIDNNIRTDYNKLRHLIRLDKKMGMNASIIQDIVTNGETVGTIKTAFPAEDLAKPDNFKSLLYYFGMLTISGMYKGKTKLTIPNQVVQEQLYTYLLNTYNEADLSFSNHEKDELASALAYDGAWQSYFGYIADCLKRYASQRDKQKGEFFVHGFTLAMTAQNRFYRPISEADTQAGYADIFLCPLLDIYPDMQHSYIIELKYAKYKDPEDRVEELRKEGIAQANRYADTDTVQNTVGSTQLHKIVVVYKGMEMRVCEEV
mgnify:FL=1